MDSAGRIVEWNLQAEATFGWPRAAVLGKELAETIIPVRHREAHRRGLANFIATGESGMLNRRIELEGWHREGPECCWWRITYPRPIC